MAAVGFDRVAGFGEFALLRPVALLPLLLGVTASAQPVPAARERQDRRVVLSNGAAPVPELRVAAGVATLLLFDAPLDRGSVEMEGRERFRLVDVGERVLALEPAADLGTGERLGLRIRFANGAAQGQGIFVLVSHPTEVDARVEVFQQQDSVELLRAELVEARAQLKAQVEELHTFRTLRDAGGPTGLIMTGALDFSGVQGSRVKVVRQKGHGKFLVADDVTSFRASTWAAMSVEVRNTGRPPWAPTTARIVNSKSGIGVAVRSIRSALPRIASGESGMVVVETEVPPWAPGEMCFLELSEGEGASQVLVPGIPF
ncbi:DUF2381 family protein [Myxococcus sp. K15C18031901]|uniref:DUF2381 family protein n=1 Tax=Myxococcus dinghuensis TaxID=2906761 RepID=UPI0020A7A576|nr:DUF2381 family protein [Myxococcus dinghuensis]MCP3105517.1 DUF2381 family protein [Myxococcus dinghuensis]